MLLQDSRRAARTSAAGDIVLLDEQDRSLWNREAIAEGLALVQGALASRRFGPYTLQAAIAACHARALTAEDTDWASIVGFYGALARITPSPVVELNRAVALSMLFGPAAGLAVVEALTDDPMLKDYHLLPSVRGDLLRKLGRFDEARTEFERAAGMTRNAREQTLLRQRAAECAAAG
jgi:predicted RNA polymerase sigma factor